MMIRKFLYKRTTEISIILVITILTGCAPSLDFDPGPEPTRDPVLEATIIRELETHDPKAVPLYQEATQAGDDGDFENAYILYGQLVDLVPEFPTVYRRLSYIESYRGNYSVAIELARMAVDLDPNGYNQSALAVALLDEGTPQATREAFNLASSAVEKLPNDDQAVLALMVSAWLAFEEDVMRQSNERLLELYPGHFLAHYVAGILAASDGKWFKAERELLISQELGMPPEAIQDVMDSGLAWNLLLIRSVFWGILAIGIWFIGLGILYLVGGHLSKTTIQALASETRSGQTQISPGEQNLRSRYRAVIRILSIYYYISIPFVVLLVLVVVASAYYIFSLLGFFPIYVVGILGLVLVVSLIAVLRAVFRRVKDTPPGIELARDQVPQLWAMNDDIASMLNIRSVDMIYLTPDESIAVNESGSLMKRMRGAGVRNLILGMGVLPGLTQCQFAAVLAHEYGHFSNQDTAGGILAYRVYVSLDQMARQLISGGAAFRFNPVWLFVVFYQRVYLKVTLGAKRLQEVLADRYAAYSIGSENLVAGLINVVQESIRFRLKAQNEIKRSLEKKIGIRNLYKLQINEDLMAEFETKYTEELTEKTSDFASHPALQERIDRISSYMAANKPIQNGDLPLLDLIPEAEELQEEMTQKIADRIPGL
ncbi:MAG: M48 family metalloprotease [Anaerolineales bacterium]|nr:M48 family metalloprotease [Anaerolineales bacterium]